MSKDNQSRSGEASGKNTEKFERLGGNSPIGPETGSAENALDKQRDN
jgi:hypothetical protein